ncbi:Diaminopimelate epimerase-like protein [Hypoxylon trugodes]|uniref:Diaminopimelate epimerase-like protein n=1 Tax=Hypoxylon trugodes TaxID=326681 RepID=UPI002197CBD4|nr:Diaminopimelate epimerase-like protein [Hypoxylon trugodes]KAI1388610.1 Diaminopimelate epimerase-like protein [Hypoxylon trugodes]
MSLDFTTFDVFTTIPFRGNPLAIVHVPSNIQLAQNQKQLIAREFNLSETVFLHEQTPADIKARIARIDIFTALAEVPFAGHPTVGTANYLLHHLHLDSAHVLSTKAGPLPFKEITFPPNSEAGAQISVAHNMHIHSTPFAGTPYSHFPVVSIVNGMSMILARQPDLAALAAQTGNLVGIENTYGASAKLDEGWRNGPVLSYFYVDLGVTGGVRKLRTRTLSSREDPATGSAASALTAYLTLSEGKEGSLVRKYEITQGVEMGRRSVIRVQVTLNEARDGIREVLLSGSAVRVLEGKVPIPDVGLAVYE